MKKPSEMIDEFYRKTEPLIMEEFWKSIDRCLKFQKRISKYYKK